MVEHLAREDVAAQSVPRRGGLTALAASSLRCTKVRLSSASTGDASLAGPEQADACATALSQRSSGRDGEGAAGETHSVVGSLRLNTPDILLIKRQIRLEMRTVREVQHRPDPRVALHTLRAAHAR